MWRAYIAKASLSYIYCYVYESVELLDRRDFYIFIGMCARSNVWYPRRTANKSKAKINKS